MGILSLLDGDIFPYKILFDVIEPSNSPIFEDQELLQPCANNSI